MAFDGITLAAIRSELDQTLTGGRIAKITQPETDELILTIKNMSHNHRLLLSASASLPLAYLVEEGKKAPMTAPGFCMLLRKHIGSGRLLSIEQPGLERVLIFHFEHRNELGDLCRKQLIVELMGKHSNIIFTDDQGVILDSIKRVPAHVSSVREVLPGRTWFIPRTTDKTDPLSVSREDFAKALLASAESLQKTLYLTYTGLSPLVSSEICHRSGLHGEELASALTPLESEHIWHIFSGIMGEVRQTAFSPFLYRKDGEPFEFAAIELTQFAGAEKISYSSVSRLIHDYFSDREIRTRIRQKSTDLRKLVATITERTAKKLQLQEKQMRDTEKKDRYRIYGEMLHTYGYQARPEARSLEVINYYTNEPLTIPLDPDLTAAENAKRFFDRYGKLKRTAEALSSQIAETRSTLEHLESISTSLDLAVTEDDLGQIRSELADYGFTRHQASKGKGRIKISSQPLHFVSSDGFDMYVGKNNYQNEEVSFKIASGSDWWFHAKGMPGSHVVVRARGAELPDRTFEEAASLAAYYSKGRSAPKVEIDYTQKKNLRKPGGARPGFVVYYTNYSMMAEPAALSDHILETNRQ